MDVNFFAYRHDNPLRHVFPIKGKVKNEVNLSDEKWLLVQLSKTIKYQDKDINFAMIKRADKGIISPKKTNQLVHFKMVPEPELITSGLNDISKFPLEIWALCR